MVEPKQSQLYNMRHSLAHILAAAVGHLHKGVKFGIGPVIEDGFYYDFNLKDTLSTEDLGKIEAEMKKIIKADVAFEKLEVSQAEAKKLVAGQPYKQELLEQLLKTGTTDVEVNPKTAKPLAKDDKVTFFKIGDFVDLCRGGHVDTTGQVGAFKLDRVAGAYWRGSEQNPMLQRVYGVAFASTKEVDTAIARRAEAAKRDHRKLGQQLDLFLISDLVGRGLPLFTPKGTVLREKLNRLSQSLRSSRGFQRVWTPHIGKRQLYETSGHWDKFGEELFLVKSQETDDELVLKPMNCPHHQQIYAAQQRSYRDLPLKYMETTTIYRDEKSGELHGLSRVRSVTQDDTHIFCMPEQIDEVAAELLEITKEFYTAVDLKLKVRLSFRNHEPKYLGEPKLWDKAQSILEELAKSNKLDYHIAEGEAAFYGPKIDMIAVDSLDREWQLATIQLDFVQPARFKLEYTDDNGKPQTPVMVHFALMGAVERFLSVYIEHTGGAFPIWLAPEQIRLITLNDEKKVTDFAAQAYEKLREAGVRAHLDDRNESVSKKIRDSEIEKVPYAIVIGGKEVEGGKFVPRVRKDIAVEHKEQAVSLDQLTQTIVNESKSLVRYSSL